MRPENPPGKLENRPFSRKHARAAILLGSLALLLGMGTGHEAAAQDLLRTLAEAGMLSDSAYADPHCFIQRQSGFALGLAYAPRTPPVPDVPSRYRYYPPARNMSLQIRPEPPASRRSVDVRVRPEPVRKPVGTWTSGGYVLNGSIPVQQPAVPVNETPRHRAPADDYSPTQKQLKKMNR